MAGKESDQGRGTPVQIYDRLKKIVSESSAYVFSFIGLNEKQVLHHKLGYAAALILAGCGGSGGALTPPFSIPSLSISPASVTEGNAGISNLGRSQELTLFCS